MAVGVDIEDIDRFKDKSNGFIERVFTPLETEYCLKHSKPESHFAVRFCAKEAVIKALSALDVKNVGLSQIEIFHNENKCPQVRILKQLDKDIVFNLSLSHDRSKAIAFVIADEIIKER